MMDEDMVVDANQLMNQAALRNLGISWLLDSEKVEQIKNLRDIALGNCRLLYGSERFKFYDIVVAEDEENASFNAILTCSQDGSTKMLRKDIRDCPVKAVRTMVGQLQKDTALLMKKYDTGSQFRGQQGFKNEKTQKFELDAYVEDERMVGPDDDTKGLRYRDLPRGPRADRGGPKRVRMDSGLPYDG
ncbi:Nn.00g050570.m01.CDS01 [Neocucurbitaria sp. VM-36]